MRLVGLVILGLAACAAEGEFLDDEVELEADGKADAAAELSVRTGETTVWMRQALERRGDQFVMRGRASRNVIEGMGFIIDDPYGQFEIKSARTFEVTWSVSEARTLVDGVDQFVRMVYPHSNGRPDSLTARAIVRPRFSTFTGSSSIYLTAELTPVVQAGETVYRAKGKTSAPFASLQVSLDGEPLAVTKIDATRFEIDLAPHVALRIAGSTSKLNLAARLATGARVEKQAALGLSIKKLAVTAGDPYEKFPRPDCPAATKTCLLALPDGTLDTASCGEAFVVNSCARVIGIRVTDVDVQTSIASGHAVTGSPAFLSDATGLVGAARAPQLVGGAEQTLDDRVSQTFARWLLTPTAKTKVLTSAVDGAIAQAYLRPLDLVEPTTFTVIDDAAMRNAAADGLLAELAAFDFESTEFSRSYAQLVGEFRARHVESIREFRESNPIELGSAESAVVTGRWLDAYVEVAVSRSTAEVTRTLIEID